MPTPQPYACLLLHLQRMLAVYEEEQDVRTSPPSELVKLRGSNCTEPRMLIAGFLGVRIGAELQHLKAALPELRALRAECDRAANMTDRQRSATLDRTRTLLERARALNR